MIFYKHDGAVKRWINWRDWAFVWYQPAIYERQMRNKKTTLWSINHGTREPWHRPTDEHLINVKILTWNTTKFIIIRYLYRRDAQKIKLLLFLAHSCKLTRSPATETDSLIELNPEIKYTSPIRSARCGKFIDGILLLIMNISYYRYIIYIPGIIGISWCSGVLIRLFSTTILL